MRSRDGDYSRCSGPSARRSPRRAGQGQQVRALDPCLSHHRPGVDGAVLGRVAVVGLARARGSTGHRDRSGRCERRRGRADRDPVQVLCIRTAPWPRPTSTRSCPLPPRSQFTRRIVFDTAAGWSANAEETLARGVAQRVDIGYLADAAIDWSQFSWATPEIVVPTGKKALRPHQQKALDDVRAGLRRARPRPADHGVRHRQDVHLRCGSPRRQVGAGGSVLFLVPSIRCCRRRLREWMAEGRGRHPAVRGVLRRPGRAQARRPTTRTSPPIDLTEPATTDPQTLLTRGVAGRHGRRADDGGVLHLPVDRRGRPSAQELGLPDFDLVICDEAHRTTGVTLAGEDESAFVRVHDPTTSRRPSGCT